jgi:hypothetical protein
MADKPVSYSMPYDKQQSQITDVSFDGEWVQKLELNLEKIIPLVLTNQSCRPDWWLVLLSDLSYILNVVNRKEDFTSRELDILQDDIDEWAENWIAVNGREGYTSYTHQITCHTIQFIRKWRNLYRCSNQGCEYQNKIIRNRYHHHTHEGGGEGNNGGQSSKIKPIGIWHLRVMCWMASLDKTALDKTDETRKPAGSDDDISFGDGDDTFLSDVSVTDIFDSCDSGEVEDLSEPDKAPNLILSAAMSM